MFFRLETPARKSTNSLRFERRHNNLSRNTLTLQNDHGYCEPTTRTQATIVWFPVDKSTTFQVAGIHARMIKFH